MTKDRSLLLVYLLLWLVLALLPAAYALASDSGYEAVRHGLEGWLGGSLSDVGL